MSLLDGNSLLLPAAKVVRFYCCFCLMTLSTAFGFIVPIAVSISQSILVVPRIKQPGCATDINRFRYKYL